MDVSVIIVNYNTKDLLLNCIKSIYSVTEEVEFEIIVSDNGSTDNSLDELNKKYPEVIIVRNNKNIGFGAANNSAIKHAKGKYIF